MAAPRWNSGSLRSVRQPRTRRSRAALLACALACLAGAAGAEPETPGDPAAAEPASKSDAPEPQLVYRVGAIHLEYAYPVEGAPDLQSIAALAVPLLRTPEGYAAPGKGAAGAEPVSISRPEGTPPAPFASSAIRAIDQAIAAEFGRRGILGVLVLPHPEDIGASSGRDLRPPDRTALRLVVLVNRLVEQHTIASGYRVSPSERIDNPVHERIKRNSPAQPGRIVEKQELEDYVARLNRHPGRWVDMTLGASGEPAGARLDYLVAEGRPYTLYFQASDTGTEETSEWRERFGFTQSQLTRRDDVLQLDYITGSFSEVNAVFGSYDAPIPFPWLRPDRLRGGIDGSWSAYDASEVGFEESSFEGSQWDVGGRLTANVFQYRDLFVDLFSGAHYQHVSSDNEAVQGFKDKGTVNFFFPEVGAAVERRTEISRIFLSASGEFNVASIAGTEKDDLTENQLGRSFVEESDVKIVRFEGATSFFMVPLFFPVKEPDSSLPASALSNEIFLSFRGQYTQDRLIPALQAVAGGLETVRGYPQSWIAADTLYLGRAEYRVHLPRLLPDREPIDLPLYGAFRLGPDRPSGRPDWDLILRAFLDYGRAEINDATSDEEDESTLTGTGVGAELQLPGNLILRFDYGLALNRVNGLNKFHDTFNFSIALVR